MKLALDRCSRIREIQRAAVSGFVRMNQLYSFLLAAIVASSSVVLAQNTPDNPNASSQAPQAGQSSEAPLPPVDLKSLPHNLFIDQEKLFTAPFHMSQRDWQWTVPAAFVGAISLASDTAIEKHAPTSSSTVSHAKTASNAGLAAMGAAAGGMFVLGHMHGNDQERETGLLAGEAGIDAALDTEAFSYIFGRERPFTGDDRGRFFQGDTSFPSEHAAISFAIASVIAHEYPGPLTQFLAYGAATGISVARFAGQQHFFTDLLAGGALGWYLGRQVYRAHSHYSDADVAKWGTFRKSEDVDAAEETSNLGSPYVPLDSWIYPAVERLIAMGYIQSADLGLRPWTRMECARMLQEEALKRLQNEEGNSTAEEVYQGLKDEFHDEIARMDGATNLDINLDSVYTRATEISGTPLHDGLDFGQTIINDYGRPYGQGFNNISGLSGHAVAGPLSFYVRAEYQHAAPLPGLSPSTAATIGSIDEGLPPAPTAPIATVNQVDLLEGYVGMQLNNWEISIGKQSLWWGEDASGPMLFSNNAEPILMLQINRIRPFHIPLVGSVRASYIVGRLTGYHFVYGANTGLVGSWAQSLGDQPFIVGEKLTLKPTSDLELGFSVTALFGGPGVPANLHKLLQAGFSSSNGAPGTSGDPGDRRGGFDMNYRIPGARDWLSFYADAFTDDEVNPWVAWNKAALTSGLYFARVPGIPKMDFRVEGVYTDAPGGGKTVEHGFFYENDRFVSGYTNNGDLIGSWIGREGQGADIWTSYWLNPKSKIQANFRRQKVSAQFLPGGATLTDVGVSGDYWFRRNLGVSAWVQHERWLFPVIQPNSNKDVTAAVEILFQPRNLFRHSGQP
jgi:Capsule assembly protein Wzi/PAP2 superfamily